MQDKYVGDVGDLGKHGLLNEIVKQSDGGVRIGLNWYYNKTEEVGNKDGKYIDYLNNQNKNSDRFRSCFPEVYDRLKELVSKGKRSLSETETSNILPEGTLYYSEVIPHIGKTAPQRIAAREKWFKDSLSRLEHADIIFLDPDNGIYLKPFIKSRSKSVKYVFPEEIKGYWQKGKTLVVYNHRDMSPKVRYDEKIVTCRSFVTDPNCVQVLRFLRYSVRDYIFLIQEQHRELIERTIDHLTKPPCDFLFSRYVAG